MTIGDSVTNIDKGAFYNCSNLTSITIPDSVTFIGDYAFEGCSGLTSVTIGDSVTTIGNYAFYDCSNLQAATIGSGVTSIGNSAFDNCTKLNHIAYTGTESQWNNISIDYDNTNLTSATRYYETQFTFIDNCVETGIYCPILEDYIFYAAKENGAHSYTESTDSVCNACGAIRTIYAPGDLDGVEGVDNKDVEYLLWYTLFPEDYPLPQNADFNDDGYVDNLDVEYLLWHTLFPEDYPLV